MNYATLENLFSNANKFGIIKFFIRNGNIFFNGADVAKFLGIRKNIFEKEAKRLMADSFLKFKRSGREKLYALNDKFYLTGELKNLIDKAISATDKELVTGLKKIGKVQLAVISGIFINKDNSRADMMVVGKVSPKKLDKFVRDIESKIGKELNFAVMTTDEFKYRYKMFDRFVYDMLELPHRKLISKIKIK